MEKFLGIPGNMDDVENIGKIYDITRPLREGIPVYEGDAPFKTRLTYDQDGVLVSALSMSSHAGTHIDAPAHYGFGLTVGAVSLKHLCGRALVVDAKDFTPEPGNVAVRLLIKGDITLRPGQARMLAENGCGLLGVEGLTVGGDEVHRELLGLGCIILENIDLREVPVGDYTLICLPLRVEEGEGAPARAILINNSGV